MVGVLQARRPGADRSPQRHTNFHTAELRERASCGRAALWAMARACIRAMPKKKPDLDPFFALMLAAHKSGCTCSFEEHADVKALALKWLAARTADEQAIFKVYQVTARDYGSPTGRERCVVTTFALPGEVDLVELEGSRDEF